MDNHHIGMHPNSSSYFVLYELTFVLELVHHRNATFS